MKPLMQIYSKYSDDAGCGDKGTSHSYIDVYDDLFAPIRDDQFNFLEIGIAMGHSLRMWKEYFPEAIIHGIDVIDRLNMNKEGFVIYQGDSRDYFSTDKKFRVIIDDGDHSFYSQRDTFERFFKFVDSGGLYIIEDIDVIDKNRYDFLSFADNCNIVDLREVKGRCDDVLAIYKKG